MAAYLVMKNNLKRVFHNKLTYLWMILIPAIIGLAGIMSTRIVENRIRVGVICDETIKRAAAESEIFRELEELPYLEYQLADRQSIHTEQIMGTYQYVIDTKNPEEAAAVLKEIKAAGVTEDIHGQADGMSPTNRILAMLMTAYMVIATLYAAKYIQDQDMGTVERFRMSGAETSAYITGYIASTALIVAVQVTIAMLLLIAFGSIELTNIAGILSAWVLLIAVVTIYGVFHAFVYKKEMTANMISSSFAIILSILGGTFVAVENMPVVLQSISYISPIRWITLICR
ncbi:MAG: ABC transporter permease [bacterium]|nr:ABC transporter permease [bacterium]